MEPEREARQVMEFGDWLRGELKRRDWSMADLATMVGVARSTVSRWLSENRTPEPSTCQRIAVVLGVPVDVVLEHAGYRNYATQPQEEVRARIATLEHRVADMMAEVERLQEELEEAYQELALLEEGKLYDMALPSEVALSVVREFELPDEMRPELERRLVTELVQLEPQTLARRDTVPLARRRGVRESDDEAG